MIGTRRIYQEIKDRYVSLLALSDAELHVYWESKVTVNYWGGSYNDRATDRSKKMMLNRWKKYIVKYVEPPLASWSQAFNPKPPFFFHTLEQTQLPLPQKFKC